MQEREWEGDQHRFGRCLRMTPSKHVRGCLREWEGTRLKIKDVEFKLALFTKWKQMALGTQQEMKSSIEVGF